jgi:hypothetical protein
MGKATGAAIKLAGLRVAEIGRGVGIAIAFGALVLYMPATGDATTGATGAALGSTTGILV